MVITVFAFVGLLVWLFITLMPHNHAVHNHPVLQDRIIEQVIAEKEYIMITRYNTDRRMNKEVNALTQMGYFVTEMAQADRKITVMLQRSEDAAPYSR